MAYAVPIRDGWQRLKWPAIKLSDGTEVRPGEQGVTAELLAAVGAVEVVDPGPTLDPATEVIDTRTLADVDGVPTIVYTVRDKTAEELAVDQQAAEDQAERDAAKNMFLALKTFNDTANRDIVAADVVANAKRQNQVLMRLIRDQYGR